jgi:hypothetical protein
VGGVWRWGEGLGGNGGLTDPDQIRAVDGDGVAAPDVLGVELVSSVLVHTSDYVELTSVIWMFWMMTASPRQQDSLSLQQQPPPVQHTVLGPIRHPQALAPQYALRSHADNALVGPDIDTRNARLVIGHADARGARAGVPVCAPRRVVDCVLATVAGALVRCRTAACFDCCAF